MNCADIIYYVSQFLDLDSYLVLSATNHFINFQIENICKRYVENKLLYGLNTYLSSYIAHHKIKSKCEELEICSHLEITNLYLYDRSIRTFPNEITFLSQLAYLDLEQNDIFSIPRSISRLSNLQDLYLSDNHIQTIKPICQLYNLKKLDLSWNKISEIPDQISQLTNLNNLDLCHNEITDLETLTELRNLKYLHVQYNDLTTVPNNLCHLTNLQYLSICHQCNTNSMEYSCKTSTVKNGIINLLTDLCRCGCKVYMYDNSLTNHLPTSVIINLNIKNDVPYSITIQTIDSLTFRCLILDKSGEYYVFNNYDHLSNIKLYLNQGSTESNQIKKIFHILSIVCIKTVRSDLRNRIIKKNSDH